MMFLTRFVCRVCRLSLAAVLSAGWCEAADVVPDPDTQSAIDQVAVQLGRAATQKEGLVALQQLEESHPDKKFLFEQVLWYLRSSAKTEERGYGAMGIVNKLKIDEATKIKAVVPQLDASDAEMRDIAAHVLRSVDKDKSRDQGVNFTVYEGVLKDMPSEQAAALIRYMYGRNPQVAVVSAARVYGQNVLESEVIEKANSDIHESMSYFAGRPEWWAHLYAAEVMKKNPQLRDPTIFKKLEQDNHPLVQDTIADLDKK